MSDTDMRMQREQTYPSEPSPTIPVILAGINAFVTLLASFYCIVVWDIFGYFVLTIAIILFLGTALIAIKIYKAGAILCVIGGIVTIPLGTLGIFAASIAWSHSKWYKTKPKKVFTRNAKITLCVILVISMLAIGGFMEYNREVSVLKKIIAEFTLGTTFTDDEWQYISATKKPLRTVQSIAEEKIIKGMQDYSKGSISDSELRNIFIEAHSELNTVKSEVAMMNPPSERFKPLHEYLSGAIMNLTEFCECEIEALNYAEEDPKRGVYFDLAIEKHIFANGNLYNGLFCMESLSEFDDEAQYISAVREHQIETESKTQYIIALRKHQRTVRILSGKMAEGLLDFFGGNISDSELRDVYIEVQSELNATKSEVEGLSPPSGCFKPVHGYLDGAIVNLCGSCECMIDAFNYSSTDPKRTVYYFDLSYEKLALADENMDNVDVCMENIQNCLKY